MRKPRSPYLKLARLIEDEGFEHREFAKLVGMGESTLSTRLNPKPEQKNNEWRHYEITAICRELHIPQEQIGEYFFPKVEKRRATSSGVRNRPDSEELFPGRF